MGQIQKGKTVCVISHNAKAIYHKPIEQFLKSKVPGAEKYVTQKSKGPTDRLGDCNIAYPLMS